MSFIFAAMNYNAGNKQCRFSNQIAITASIILLSGQKEKINNLPTYEEVNPMDNDMAYR